MTLSGERRVPSEVGKPGFKLWPLLRRDCGRETPHGKASALLTAAGRHRP